MTNLKKLVATVTLMGIIIIGVTNANAGILMSDAIDTQPCTEKIEKVDNGIIVNTFGIIVNNIGIIVNSIIKDEAPTECGIIVNS